MANERENQMDTTELAELDCIECGATATANPNPVKDVVVRDTRYSQCGDPTETDFDAQITANGWVVALAGDMCPKCHNIPERTVVST